MITLLTLTFIFWLRYCSWGLFTIKLLFFPFHSLKASQQIGLALKNLLKILYIICSSSREICLFSAICLFMAVWTHVYFMLWVIIQCHVVYFHTQVIPTMAIGNFFTLASMYLHLKIFSLSTSFLLLQGVHLIFLLYLVSAISPRNPGFFCLRVVFETKIWVFGCACTYRDAVAPKPSQWTKLSNIYMHVNSHSYSFEY